MASPMSSVTDPVTSLFAGKYRLIKVLGKGAMGEVWLAEEEGIHNVRRRVAVKRLLTNSDIGDYATESFIAEAQVVAKLDHPNVVRLVELGAADGGLYLVLDYVDGTALDRLIRKSGPLSPKAVAFMGREIARALEAVHNMCDDDGRNYGVVHRDVSPSNILLGRDGRVRLSDFGVARISGLGGEKTQTGVFKGKLPYMPPEQARGEPFDGRADIFSLGVTLFEAAMGGRLRRAETQGQLITMIATERIPPVADRVPGLPPLLARAIDSATEFDAKVRVADAGEFASMLDEALRSFGPRADKEARDELRDRVARLVGAAPQPTASQSSGLGVHIMSEPTGQIGEVPKPPGKPAEWSVPLGSPSDPPPPEQSSQPSVNSVIRSTASANSAANLGGDEPATIAISSMAPQAAAPQPPTRSNRWLAIAALGLVTAAVASVLVLQRVLGTGTAPAPTTGAEASAPRDTPTAAPSAALPVASALGVTTAAPTAEPVASATSTPARTTPRPGGPPTPRAAASADDGNNASSSDPGTLQVVVLPWADVLVDGRSVGTTPIAPVSLTPGNHTVVLRNSELGASRSLGVTIKSGKPTLLRVDLRRTE